MDHPATFTNQKWFNSSSLCLRSGSLGSRVLRYKEQALFREKAAALTKAFAAGIYGWSRKTWTIMVFHLVCICNNVYIYIYDYVYVYIYIYLLSLQPTFFWVDN